MVSDPVMTEIVRHAVVAKILAFNAGPVKCADYLNLGP